MSSPTSDRGGDLVEHEMSERCVCGPRATPVKQPDGSIDWIYVHHTLSGAEFDEPDYAGPPRPIDPTA